MSVTGRQHGVVAGELAGQLRDAGFVRVLARPDGDALAAAGLLARGLSAVDVPFKVSVAPTPGERASRPATGTEETTLTVGTAPGADATRLDDGDSPASVTAHEVTAALDGPAPVLALAGTVAAGVTPGTGDTAVLLEQAGLDRRPGVAVPTADLADGLAHSTTLHASFSGDEEAARAMLADLSLPAEMDEEARRRVASAVALKATGGGTPPSAATAIERVLRPYPTPDAPFATLGGFADVLDALAERAPGVGVGLALDRDVSSEALSVWRRRSRAAHTALRTAASGRYAGLSVVRGEDAPVSAVARLYRDYRSPEPAALAVGDGDAALATGDADAGDVARTVADAIDGEADVRATHATLRFDADLDENDLIQAVREAL